MKGYSADFFNVFIIVNYFTSIAQVDICKRVYLLLNTRVLYEDFEINWKC